MGMDDFLQIKQFQDSPSTFEFASQIECRNAPAVFHGCIKDWKAFKSWNPSHGGLDYLQEQIGSSVVQAMLSRYAPVFYGDLRRHERVPLPFSTFIDSCKQHLANIDDEYGDRFEPERPSFVNYRIGQNLLSGEPEELYLAQVPILNFENKDVAQLKTLSEDIQIPTFLEKNELASINLWMNNAQTRSSTHYDPNHNLLCIVAGCKQVTLWPPSVSPLLYPMPLYGESSNHSSVGLENPDFVIHPRAKCVMEYSQMVILHAGDALFIPEGWFHQVDSADLTIAVNFWWQSNMMSGMLKHMDAYYLRRIMRRLIDKEMNQVLHKASTGMKKLNMHGSLFNNEATDHEGPQKCQVKDDGKNNKPWENILLHELGSPALQALHELVSLVHEHLNFTDQQLVEPEQTKDSSVSLSNGWTKIVTTTLFRLEDDPISKIIWILEPLTLKTIFLAMAHNFPRTLEGLILHLLSPIGAEVLTQKFDEMDQQTTEEDRNNFYQIFYGVFDDQFATMDSILKRKESFAFQMFKHVFNQYLGVELKEPNL